MKTLKNIPCIITGGASGMGAVTATYLAKQGAKVALFDMNMDKAESLAKELHGIAVQCDVSSAESAERAVKEAKEIHGATRVLVNCAGIAPGKRIVGKDGVMSLSDFKRVIDINLIGSFNI